MTDRHQFILRAREAADHARFLPAEIRCRRCMGAGLLADAPGSGMPTPVLPGLWIPGDPILQPGGEPYACTACGGTGDRRIVATGETNAQGGASS